MPPENKCPDDETDPSSTIHNTYYSEHDLYTLLEEKENDLTLAAELGKALLEQNEELSRQNEIISEDFASKLEVREDLTFGVLVKVELFFMLDQSMFQVVKHKRWRACLEMFHVFQYFPVNKSLIW